MPRSPSAAKPYRCCLSSNPAGIVSRSYLLGITACILRNRMTGVKIDVGTLIRVNTDNDAKSEPATPLTIALSRPDALKYLAAKIRQVIGIAAGHKVPIDHDWLVFPDRARIHEIVFDSERSRYAHAAIDTG